MGRFQMFMRNFLWLCCLIPTFAFADTPGLGQPIDESEVGSLTVFASGQGLPEPQRSVSAGRILYERDCFACHGEEGRGSLNDQLAGGHVGLDAIPEKRTIGSYWPYAAPVFDYVRRAMPYANPGSLTDDEVYALTAYLLYVNDVVPADTVLDAEKLKQVKMPNRERFFSSFKLPK